MSENSKNLTRGELYELIWKEPTTKLAARFGISDVAVAKLCKRLKIPKPPIGYWARFRAGKLVVKTPPLPDLPSDDGRPVLEKREESSPKRDRFEHLPDFLRDFIQTEIAKTPECVIPESLANPHTVTRHLGQELRRQKLSDSGIVYASTKGIAVSVAKANVPRALRILDPLLKNLGKRGFLEFGRPEDTEIKIQGQALPIRLQEKTLRFEKENQKREVGFWHPRYEYHPTGQLSFKIDTWLSSGARKTWTDGKRQRLEIFGKNIIENLLIVAAGTRWQEMERERQRVEWEERQQRERDEKRRRFVENSARTLLQKQAASWSECSTVRRFVQEVMARAEKELGSAEIGEQIFAWQRWALEHADRLDPLEAGVEAFLGVVESKREEAEEKANYEIY